MVPGTLQCTKKVMNKLQGLADGRKLGSAHTKTVCFGGVHEATHIPPLTRFRAN